MMFILDLVINSDEVLKCELFSMKLSVVSRMRKELVEFVELRDIIDWVMDVS